MLPDLVGVSLQSLLTRVAKLEGTATASRPAASSGRPRRSVARRGLLHLSPSDSGWPSGALQDAFIAFTKIGATVT